MRLKTEPTFFPSPSLFSLPERKKNLPLLNFTPLLVEEEDEPCFDDVLARFP